MQICMVVLRDFPLSCQNTLKGEDDRDSTGGKPMN